MNSTSTVTLLEQTGLGLSLVYVSYKEPLHYCITQMCAFYIVQYITYTMHCKRMGTLFLYSICGGNLLPSYMSKCTGTDP